jgi:SWI/SNF-related matrix-associated actin-dependent regulator 1 of chromatin subfamily A
MPKGIDLYDFQKRDILTIEDYDGHLLNASEMGTGKTIEHLFALYRNPSWLPALIVVPASVKYNWKYEAARFGFNCSVCEGQKPPIFNRFDLSLMSPLTIINYDILKYWVEYLKKLEFKTLICDEVQALINPSAERTKATKHMVQHVQRCQMLSGTPLTNRASELFSVLNMLWPNEFPSFPHYAVQYCPRTWTPWGWDYSRSANTQHLHGRLKSLGMIRNRKVDVLKDLPEIVRQIVPCELTDQKEYDTASRDFIGWLKQNMPHKARSASRAEKLTRVGYLVRLAAKLKMRAVVDWMLRYFEETEDKLVMFAHHLAALDVMERRVPIEKLRVDGGVDAKMRQVAKEQFQNDPKYRLWLGQLQASGVGITLTAAPVAGFADFFYRPGDFIQAEARIHRIGQKVKAWVNYFVADQTIEMRLCEILQEKQGIISSVLDGTDPSHCADLNIFDILLQEIEKNL